jgi:hypothetical protein
METRFYETQDVDEGASAYLRLHQAGQAVRAALLDKITENEPESPRSSAEG